MVERPPAEWYRNKIGAIRKATDGILALIREPTGTGLSQLRFETLRSMGRPLRGPGPIQLSSSWRTFLQLADAVGFPHREEQ